MTISVEDGIQRRECVEKLEGILRRAEHAAWTDRNEWRKHLLNLSYSATMILAADAVISGPATKSDWELLKESYP